MDSARSVGPRPPHQPCRLQYIRTLPSQNPRIRGIPLHSWHGTPKTKFPISFPANLPRPSQPCGQQILPAPGGRHPFPSSYSERERAERCRDSRTRPFLYLSLKIPPGEPECGPRTIFRAPPPSCWHHCHTSLGQHSLPPPRRAVGRAELPARAARTAAPLSHPITPAASERPARWRPSPPSSLKTTELIIFLPAVPPRGTVTRSPRAGCGRAIRSRLLGTQHRVCTLGWAG